MTGPLPDWAERFDQQARGFEQTVEQETSAALRIALADAARRLAAEYVKTVGDLKTPVPAAARESLREAVRRILLALLTGFASELPRIIEALSAAVEQGLQLGAHAMPDRPRRMRLAPSAGLRQAVRDAEKVLRQAIADARAYVERADPGSYRDVTLAVAKSAQVATRAEAAARWLANRAANEGAAAVADANGAQRMWVAERDACLTCLAYSGRLAEPGEPFPAGLTFGDKSTVTAPLYSPPAHPNCRCRIQPWYGSEPSIGVQLPQALQREAQRSVLRGDSDFASRLAKLSAADRLLRRATSGLPETVKLRARRNVNAGPVAWRPAKRTTRP